MWNILGLIAVLVGRCAIDIIFDDISSEPSCAAERTQSVNGYIRRDGTFVRSYIRRHPR